MVSDQDLAHYVESLVRQTASCGGSAISADAVVRQLEAQLRVDLTPKNREQLCSGAHPQERGGEDDADELHGDEGTLNREQLCSAAGHHWRFCNSWLVRRRRWRTLFVDGQGLVSNRSPDMYDTIEFAVHVSTSVESTGALKSRIKGYLESKPTYWHPIHAVYLKGYLGCEQDQYGSVCPAHNEKGIRRSELVMELKKMF